MDTIPTYIPLPVALESHWDKPFADLPDDLKRRLYFGKETSLWDDLTLGQRKQYAHQMDDPDNWTFLEASEYLHGFNSGARPAAAQPGRTKGDDGTIDKIAPTLTKLGRQQQAILSVIAKMQLEPMKILDGGRGNIKISCEADYPKLFGKETSFDWAWKCGIKKLWKMESHESYVRRGK